MPIAFYYCQSGWPMGYTPDIHPSNLGLISALCNLQKMTTKCALNDCSLAKLSLINLQKLSLKADLNSIVILNVNLEKMSIRLMMVCL